jgi:hypothetical protein
MPGHTGHLGNVSGFGQPLAQKDPENTEFTAGHAIERNPLDRPGYVDSYNPSAR